MALRLKNTLRWTGFAHVNDLIFLVSETESTVQNVMWTLSFLSLSLSPFFKQIANLAPGLK